jgi:hypothetical protein
MTARTSRAAFYRGLGIAFVMLAVLAFAIGYLLHPMM